MSRPIGDGKTPSSDTAIATFGINSYDARLAVGRIAVAAAWTGHKPKLYRFARIKRVSIALLFNRS